MISLRTSSLAFALVVVGCSSEGSSGTSSGGGGTNQSDRRGNGDQPTDREPTDPGESTDGPNNPSGPSAPSKKKNGAQCKASADCESDFCVFLSGGSNLGMCTTTCDSNLDCDLGYDCTPLNDAPQKVCIPN